MRLTSCLSFALILLLLFSSCAFKGESEVSVAGVPEASEVVYGKIREANGNEITVALLNYGADTVMQGAAGSGTPPGAATGGAGGEPNTRGDMGSDATQRQSGSGASASRPAQSGEGTQQAAPSGEGAQRSGGGAGATGARGASFVAGGAGMAGSSSSYTLTGEDATFIIPVTVDITTGDGENARTIRFTQLSYKNVVKISFDEAGNIIALQVLE